MAKFYGKIGFIKSDEYEPGAWENVIEEHSYYGDITKMTSSFQNSDGVNQNINVNNTISIVADAYARGNFQYMKYVTINNIKWEIKNVELQHPRLILTIGGLYNEE